MIVLLALIFWITIAGANVPSAYLSAFFVQLEAWLHQACEQLHVAKLLEGLFVDGMVTVSYTHLRKVTSMKNIGIMGLGKISHRVAKGIAYAHNAQLYAVASRNIAHAQDFQKQDVYKRQVYTLIRRLYESIT